VAVTDDEARADQWRLARSGLHLELSSAASLAGARALVRGGVIRPGERVVVVATSHGYKEFEPGTAPIAPTG